MTQEFPKNSAGRQTSNIPFHGGQQDPSNMQLLYLPLTHTVIEATDRMDKSVIEFPPRCQYVKPRRVSGEWTSDNQHCDPLL